MPAALIDVTSSERAPDLAPGPTDEHQHESDDGHDDANGRQERDGEHDAEEQEDESGDDHD